MTKSLENKINDAVHSVEPSHKFTESLWKEMRVATQPAPAPRLTPSWRWLPVTIVDRTGGRGAGRLSRRRKCGPACAACSISCPASAWYRWTKARSTLSEPVSLDTGRHYPDHSSRWSSDGNQTVISFGSKTSPTEANTARITLTTCCYRPAKNCSRPAAD